MLYFLYNKNNSICPISAQVTSDRTLGREWTAGCGAERQMRNFKQERDDLYEICDCWKES